MPPRFSACGANCASWPSLGQRRGVISRGSARRTRSRRGRRGRRRTRPSQATGRHYVLLIQVNGSRPIRTCHGSIRRCSRRTDAPRSRSSIAPRPHDVAECRRVRRCNGAFLALIRRISGVDPSILAAAVFLCFPFSSYTVYLMPGDCLLSPFRSPDLDDGCVCSPVADQGTTLAGVLVGTMLLVKPHAVAMFLAVLLTLGVRGLSPSSFRPAARSVLGSLLLFIVAVYVTLVGLNRVLSGTWMLHPLMFVGGLTVQTWRMGSRCRLGPDIISCPSSPDTSSCSVRSSRRPSWSRPGSCDTSILWARGLKHTTRRGTICSSH